MVARGKIIIVPSVTDYLNELIKVLHDKGYFAYLTSAENYVSDIYDFIEENINLVRHYNSPTELSSFGTFYITYNPNRRTTWYIFFEKKHENYLIIHISNNHSKLSNLMDSGS